MVAYKDILNTFGGDTSYADRFQAAALKGDQAGMSDIIREYKGVGTSTPPETPIPTQDTQGDNLGNWNYQDDSADRQDQIVSNLNEAYQQNPDQFKDWATFSQNFNYDTAGRSDKQKETMRNRYSQTQQGNIDYNDANNTDYFFNQLMGGGQISGEGAALDAARNRYKNYQYLSGMTPDQIASAIASNSINPVGQEMQDLKNYSPALYAQVQAAIKNQTAVDDINSIGTGIYDGLTKTTSNSNYTKYNFTDEYAKNASVIKQYNESLYKKIEGLGGDTAAYVAIVASMLQNPLIQANKDEIENIEGEIRKIQENIYTVGDTARSRLGSEAPEDLVSAYISQQTKQLQNQLRTAQNSLLVAQGKLNNQLSDVETMIDAINNGIEYYGEGGTGSGDYQFVSGTKYQKAGYFNKKTGEFIPLDGSGTGGGNGGGNGGGGGYVDKHNYTDDSTERLKEIANNLESLYKSNPSLFNNRSTFNDYFKYNQRSAKQKQVLDAYWAKYGNKFSIGGMNDNGTNGESSGGMSDDFVKTVKKDLLSGKILSLSASDMKKQYPQYWNIGRADSASASLVSKIGYISSLDEIDKLSTALSDSLTDNLYKGYWSNPKSITTAANKVKSIGNGSSSKERQSIIVYLNGLDISQARREKILKEAGISDSNITKILAGK